MGAPRTKAKMAQASAVDRLGSYGSLKIDPWDPAADDDRSSAEIRRPPRRERPASQASEHGCGTPQAQARAFLI